MSLLPTEVNPPFRSRLLTDRASVRILFGEPNISHFGILSAFWLTQQRHLPAKLAILRGSGRSHTWRHRAADFPDGLAAAPFKGKLSESPSTSARWVNSGCQRAPEADPTCGSAPEQPARRYVTTRNSDEGSGVVPSHNRQRTFMFFISPIRSKVARHGSTRSASTW
jgi:hypothetical protein